MRTEIIFLFLSIVLSSTAPLWQIIDNYPTNYDDYTPNGLGSPGVRGYHSFTRLPNDSVLLFAGSGDVDSAEPLGGNSNGLWRFDPQANQWYFLSGNKTLNSPGLYTSSGNGYPSARGLPAAALLSNLSLIYFSGLQNTSMYFNDLWRYDTQTNKWYFMNGNSVINSLGSYTTLATPSARYDVSFAVLLNESLIAFGGIGFNASNVTGYLNDLWRYEPLSNQWFFINGNKTLNVLSSYSETLMPGGRGGYSMVTLANNTVLLFGGVGTFIATNGYTNEMWLYDPSLNIYYFVNGITTPNFLGNNSTVGLGFPGSRTTSFTPFLNGSIFLFGGYGFDTSNYYTDYLNDAWRYDPNTNLWYFLVGNESINTLPNFDGYNVPNGRLSPTVVLSNSSAIFFGGRANFSGGEVFINDVWIFGICDCAFGACSSINSLSCSSCMVGYFGPNCIEKCSCLGSCVDGPTGNGSCITTGGNPTDSLSSDTNSNTSGSSTGSSSSNSNSITESSTGSSSSNNKSNTESSTSNSNSNTESSTSNNSKTGTQTKTSTTTTVSTDRSFASKLGAVIYILIFTYCLLWWS